MIYCNIIYDKIMINPAEAETRLMMKYFVAGLMTNPGRGARYLYMSHDYQKERCRVILLPKTITLGA